MHNKTQVESSSIADVRLYTACAGTDVIISEGGNVVGRPVVCEVGGKPVIVGRPVVCEVGGKPVIVGNLEGQLSVKWAENLSSLEGQLSVKWAENLSSLETWKASCL